MNDRQFVLALGLILLVIGALGALSGLLVGLLAAPCMAYPYLYPPITEEIEE